MPDERCDLWPKIQTTPTRPTIRLITVMRVFPCPRGFGLGGGVEAPSCPRTFGKVGTVGSVLIPLAILFFSLSFSLRLSLSLYVSNTDG